jgi:antitoxin MazE
LEEIMRARIVRIGSSRGIRFPRSLIQKAGVGEDVEIVVRGNSLVISPTSHPRAGWSDAFRDMVAHGDDALIDESLPTRWDKSEWEW